MASTKGIPWSTQEHEAFLKGLEKCGKGNWKAISTFFVPSRSCTQVASHAQKYFQKLDAQLGIERERKAYVKGGRGRPPRHLSAAKPFNNDGNDSDKQPVSKRSDAMHGSSSPRDFVNSADINNHLELLEDNSAGSNSEQGCVVQTGDLATNSSHGTNPNDVDRLPPRVVINTRHLMDIVSMPSDCDATKQAAPARQVDKNQAASAQQLDKNKAKPDAAALPVNRTQDHGTDRQTCVTRQHDQEIVRYVYEEHVLPDGSVRVVRRRVSTSTTHVLHPAAAPGQAQAHTHPQPQDLVDHRLQPQIQATMGQSPYMDVPPPEYMNMMGRGMHSTQPAVRAAAASSPLLPAQPLVPPEIILSSVDRQYHRTEQGTFLVIRVPDQLERGAPHALVDTPHAWDGRGVPADGAYPHQAPPGPQQWEGKPGFAQLPGPREYKQERVIWNDGVARAQQFQGLPQVALEQSATPFMSGTSEAQMRTGPADFVISPHPGSYDLVRAPGPLHGSVVQQQQQQYHKAQPSACATDGRHPQPELYRTAQAHGVASIDRDPAYAQHQDVKQAITNSASTVDVQTAMLDAKEHCPRPTAEHGHGSEHHAAAHVISNNENLNGQGIVSPFSMGDPSGDTLTAVDDSAVAHARHGHDRAVPTSPHQQHRSSPHEAGSPQITQYVTSQAHLKRGSPSLGQASLDSAKRRMTQDPAATPRAMLSVSPTTPNDNRVFDGHRLGSCTVESAPRSNRAGCEPTGQHTNASGQLSTSTVQTLDMSRAPSTQHVPVVYVRQPSASLLHGKMQVQDRLESQSHYQEQVYIIRHADGTVIHTRQAPLSPLGGRSASVAPPRFDSCEQHSQGGVQCPSQGAQYHMEVGRGGYTLPPPGNVMIHDIHRNGDSQPYATYSVPASQQQHVKYIPIEGPAAAVTASRPYGHMAVVQEPVRHGGVGGLDVFADHRQHAASVYPGGGVIVSSGPHLGAGPSPAQVTTAAPYRLAQGPPPMTVRPVQYGTVVLTPAPTQFCGVRGGNGPLGQHVIGQAAYR